MSLSFYELIRPLLFKLDPEDAHDLALKAIETGQNTPLQCGWAQPVIEDPISLAGLRLKNRVGLAAGLDKNGRCIDGLGAMGFGFIEVGTVTPKPQAGNPKPRMFRIPEREAVINRMGFNNAGIAEFVRNIQRAHTYRQRGGIVGLNIGKNATTPIEAASDDYLIALAAVYPHADYVAINISSPNTKDLRQLQGQESLSELLQKISEARKALEIQHSMSKPIFLKIAPDLDSEAVNAVAETLLEFKINGVIATNTTTDRRQVANVKNGGESGGLSGTPVLDSSNAVIRTLRARLGASFPIIGVGGITDVDSAASKIDAGASAVQIYTGLIYKGPALVPRISAHLRSMQS